MKNAAIVISLIWLTGCTGNPVAAPTPLTVSPTPTASPAATVPRALTATSQPTSVVASPTAGAQFTQAFTVAVVSPPDTLFGSTDAVRDGNTDTWAAIRAGDGAWVFDLGGEQSLTAVKFWPLTDSGDGFLLRSVSVSGDGQTWVDVWAGSGTCFYPNCDGFAEKQWATLAFAPAAARYLRLLAGPRFSALGEVAIEAAPKP
ncbi:MAG: discoidin domain-containing protein [Chloroflexi bacterium]|nr:discoidin domain-containing protein [Chloroflexota bacterium]MBI2975395.1 discoidin domain-containing protein [Chloroflexota bacterium]MBI5292022.1 discoidin domain-containing protein [Chloroflexota bacterium]